MLKLFIFTSCIIFRLTSAVKQPNIVFILADDLGFNDVGYHNPEIISPNIDKLAREGVALENYYVQPICTPSRSQLMTGRYQIHTGLQHKVIFAPQKACLPLNEVTLPQKLKEAGYMTHMVGKWHLGFYKRECLPTNRGFDTHYGPYCGKTDYYTKQQCGFFPGWKNNQKYCGYDFRDNLDIDWSANGTYSTYLFSNRSRKIISEHDKTKPLFLYLSFQSVHSPVSAPEHYVQKYASIKNITRRTFAGMVTAMDDAIGEVVDALKATRMMANTIIVFSSDNGGSLIHGGSNLPLRGGKDSLWEGGIKSVGFVHGVGIKQTGRVSKGLFHISDWFPTLLHVAGGTLQGTKPLDGQNVWSSIAEANVSSPRTEILHNINPYYRDSRYKAYPNKYGVDTFRGQAALRIGNWKLITGDPGHKPYKGRTTIRLYNIESDPEESVNMVKHLPRVVDLMLRRLAEYNATAVPVKWPRPDKKCNPARHGNAWGPWIK